MNLEMIGSFIRRLAKRHFRARLRHLKVTTGPSKAEKRAEREKSALEASRGR